MRRGKIYEQVWVFGAVIALLIGAFIAIFFTPYFEREKPEVLNSSPYVVWNLKAPLPLRISDNVGLKEYKVSVIDGSKQTVLINETLQEPQKLINLALTYPQNAFLPSKSAKLVVQMKDASLWGWLAGNETVSEISLVIDSSPPQIKVLSNSASISKGGSALVIFEAKDDVKVTSAWLETSDGVKFKTQPYDKNNSYVAIGAWDIKNSNFKLYAMASDLAGNIARQEIFILAKNVLYKESKLQLTPQDITPKMLSLCQEALGKTVSNNPIECFTYINNKLREQNEAVVKKVTERIGDSKITSFFTEPFLPITKAKVVGSYGDHRIFFSDGVEISQSYHMGIDFASVKEALVYAPNNGVVLFVGDNGIYGKMLVIYHGLGLSTLYGHCSSIPVKEGDLVKRGQPIAKTGDTGLAFGDHLHYGVIVQGVAVRPAEWLDARWIANNFTLMFKKAGGR